MAAGIPGAGIGGLFYLASALLMPVRALVLTARGRGSEARWALAFRQSSMAVGVLLALWGTGAALDAVLAGAARRAATTGTASTAIAAAPTQSLGPYALAFSIGTLVVVLLVVQVARVVLARPSGPLSSAAPRPTRERNAA